MCDDRCDQCKRVSRHEDARARLASKQLGLPLELCKYFDHPVIENGKLAYVVDTKSIEFGLQSAYSREVKVKRATAYKGHIQLWEDYGVRVRIEVCDAENQLWWGWADEVEWFGPSACGMMSSDLLFHSGWNRLA